MSTTTTRRDPSPDDAGSTTAKVTIPRESAHDRQSVVNREKEEYGGVKVGLAFFGWLTATGTAVMLAAFAAAAGTAFGLVTSTGPGNARTQIAQDPETVGIFGAIVLVVVLFVAYYCGGYVAARMARFNGVRQGLAVWLWAVFITAVVAVLAALAGSQHDILSRLDSLPRIPVSRGTLTTGGLVALVVAAAGSLAGALLGGLAGMHFHRKVDKAGLGR
jgi:mannose/fructose/N-acetylgalactosamine-specific phosphotransferase system component IIC